MKDDLSRIFVNLLKILLLIACLDFFFVSISLLGAFKSLGAGYGERLIQELARNQILGLLMGILITSIIQSSSTTTSLVVGLVAGGVFGEDPQEALRVAIPVIMGANIGTSITNTIVALGHIGNSQEFERAFSSAVVHDFFNILAVIVFFPLQLATNFLGKAAWGLTQVFEKAGGIKFSSPIKIIVKPQVSAVKEAVKGDALIEFVIVFALALMLFQGIRFLSTRIRQGQDNFLHVIGLASGFAATAVLVRAFSTHIFSPEAATFLTGLGLLFLSLYTIVRVMRSLVLTRMERLFQDYVFRTPLLSILLGLCVTASVPSSSVTTSLMLPLAGAGILTIHQIFPYTLGSNVGTTLTAMLAALSTGTPVGIAAAFSHLLFNCIGIVLIFPIRSVPIGMAIWFARLATRSKAIPLLFVFGVYILLPLGLLLLFG